VTDQEKNYKWALEIINSETKRGGFKSALFDFDGTVSLIRQGWQDVMIPYFIEVLKKTPNHGDEISITSCVSDFVNFLTGKQTIYQCMRLDEEVQNRGGRPTWPANTPLKAPRATATAIPSNTTSITLVIESVRREAMTQVSSDMPAPTDKSRFPDIIIMP